MEIMKLFFTPDEALYDRPITDVFSSAVLESNFWLYWRTMFAFENWHSALEMKLYLKRFIHHVGGLPDFTALRFTRYNQYESMILPMLKYLEAHGGKPCEEFRIKKQGDFDWFGKTLGIVSIPRATDRLYTAAARFGQYPIHKEYVLKTIGVMHEIVRENPGEPDHPPYRLLTEEFFRCNVLPRSSS